ncbi:MAG: HD domain-containing protein [Treponema sp.]|nr:HD domain-containing protein [Treponema sp.]
MFDFIYTFSFILSFCYLFVMISLFRKRITSFYVMLFASIMIINFGYMQMADADTLKMAIYANQTVNLGYCFTPFFFLMCVADLCGKKIDMRIQTILIIYSGILFFFVSTIGITDLYYKSVYLVENHGIYLLKKEHGPLHFINPLYLFGTLIGGYFIVFQSFFNRRKVSYKNSLLLMVFMTLMVACYLIEKLSSLNIPLIPFGFNLAETGVFILLTRISMYDVASISSDVLIETSISGIICFDGKGRFLGADTDVFEWFPDAAGLKIDSNIESYISENSSDFLCQILKWIKGEERRNSVILQKKEQFFRISHSERKETKFKRIHCFFITDDTEQQKYTKLVESYNENLEKDVYNKTKKIHTIQNDIIIGMASIVENRDNSTGGHIQRTSDVVNIFVEHLKQENENYDHSFWQNIVKAAPLHDFGKIAVPDVILNKPGKFTDEEYEVMKGHAGKGAVIVEQILQNSDDAGFKQVAANVAHFHHEKWNGEGYPEKISGEDIPYEARVMALADVFDALVSKRVYKEKFSFEKAFGIIEESSGTHFDPELCSQFLKCRKELEELYSSYSD